jgi:hypothetical protein
MGAMDDRDRLTLYPYVVVRIRCRVCSRNGAYRLARLAAKFGPEISLRDLLDRFSFDCLWRAEAHGNRGVSACGVYLPDLEQLRPPDLPPGLVRLRVVASKIDGWGASPPYSANRHRRRLPNPAH